MFMQELRDAMGDEAFFAALKEYARRYAYRQADGRGFWDIASELTPMDLGSIRAKYFSNAE